MKSHDKALKKKNSKTVTYSGLAPWTNKALIQSMLPARAAL